MIADRYWLAVEREILHACRCAAFVYLPGPVFEGEPTHPLGLLSCVCEGGRRTGLVAPESQGVLPLSRLPSRVSSLVVELRNILLSLLPPCPPDGSSRRLDPLRVTPTRTHDLVNSVLDPALLTTDLHSGTLDLPALAEFLGFILKSHCAPMRDWLVERMSALVSMRERECIVQSEPGQAVNLEAVNGRRYVGLAGGLRLCFEVLELMKLVRRLFPRREALSSHSLCRTSPTTSFGHSALSCSRPPSISRSSSSGSSSASRPT